jgi:NADPH:quinone reductase
MSRRTAPAFCARSRRTYSRGDWSDEVRRHTGGKGADVVFQSTGGTIGTESLRALAPQGRLVMFGADNVVDAEGLSAEQVRALIRQGQSLGGFAYLQTADAEQRAAFTELAELVTSGGLPVDVERFPLSRVEAAHAAMEARRTVGKIVLVPGS